LLQPDAAVQWPVYFGYPAPGEVVHVTDYATRVRAPRLWPAGEKPTAGVPPALRLAVTC